MRPLESLFVVALVLYTTVIWTHRIKGNLKPWMVWTFGAGLTADTLGTVLLCGLAITNWSWSLHTVSGLLALVIMALHFAWALHAHLRGGAAAHHFHRFSLYAWVLWLVSFVTGIPVH